MRVEAGGTPTDDLPPGEYDIPTVYMVIAWLKFFCAVPLGVGSANGLDGIIEESGCVYAVAKVGNRNQKGRGGQRSHTIKGGETLG